MKKALFRLFMVIVSVVTLFSSIPVLAAEAKADAKAEKTAQTETAALPKENIPLAAPDTVQIMPGAAIALDKSRINAGILCVINDEKDQLIAVLRCLDTKIDYTYDVPKGTALIPLQVSGQYQLQIGRVSANNTAKVILKDAFAVNISAKRANERWLISSVMTAWDKDMKSIKEYAALIAAAKATDDADKIKVVYDAMVKGYTYDDTKANKLIKMSGTANYVGDADKTYKDKSGVCTDFATLFAAAMRSQGIPCRMVKGYSPEVQDTLHAWNEVFVGNEWRLIDLTADICYYEAKKMSKVTMFKDPAGYSVSKVY